MASQSSQINYIEQAKKNVDIGVLLFGYWQTANSTEPDLIDPFTGKNVTRRPDVDVRQDDYGSDGEAARRNARRKKLAVEGKLFDAILSGNLSDYPFIEKVTHDPRNLTIVDFRRTPQAEKIFQLDDSSILCYNIGSNRAQCQQIPRGLNVSVKSHYERDKRLKLAENSVVPDNDKTRRALPSETKVSFESKGTKLCAFLSNFQELALDSDSKANYFTVSYKDRCYAFIDKTSEETLTDLEKAIMLKFFKNTQLNFSFVHRSNRSNSFAIVMSGDSTEYATERVNKYICKATLQYYAKRASTKCSSEFYFTFFGHKFRYVDIPPHTCRTEID